MCAFAFICVAIVLLAIFPILQKAGDCKHSVFFVFCLMPGTWRGEAQRLRSTIFLDGSLTSIWYCSLVLWSL